MREKKKGLKALNPLTSISLVVLLGVTAAIFEYKVMVITVILMMMLAVLSGEGPGFLKLWLKSIFLLCAVCFIFQILFIPGETVVRKVFIFTITAESWNTAVSLCTRLLGIGSAAILAVKTVNVKEMVIALEMKGVSPLAGHTILSTLNIIPQMSKQMQSILEAQKSRGIEMESNLLVRAKAFFPSISPLLLSSIISAEERAITMEARAFSANCKKTKLIRVPETKRDRAIRMMAIIACILVIGGKVAWIVL